MAQILIGHLKYLYILIFFLICSSLSSCDQRTASNDSIIGYVNKEPVLASELDRVVSFEARKSPGQEITPDIRQKQLDLLIDKKLIVQEAIEAGLTRDENFIAMIKTYWEQALVRSFIDLKRKEFSKEITVTEKDFRDYYKQISKRVTFKVLAGTDKQKAQDMREQILTGNRLIDGQWKTIGPVGYQDITSDILRKAFNASQGEVLLIEDAPKYYLVFVDQKEEIPQGAFADLEPELKRRVIAIKENQMFDEWLKVKRKKSHIKIAQ